MGKKREESQRLGAGAVVFILAVLFWLVAAHPWLLVFPIVYWLCLVRPGRRTEVRRRPPLGTVRPAPPSKVIPPPAKAAPPDFIPKDREYNRYLARTWDEEFESLAKKRQEVPPS